MGEGVRPLLDAAGLLALQRHTAGLAVASYVRDYAVRLALATRPEQANAPTLVRRYVRYGASPRALQALEAAARAHALLDGPLQRGLRRRAACGARRLAAPPASERRGHVRAVDPESVVAAVLAAVPEARPRRFALGAGLGGRGMTWLLGRGRRRPA